MVPVDGIALSIANPNGLDFFEKKIRPVLIERCYECHSSSSSKLKGGFLLDTRAGIRKGGNSGRDAVIPGTVEESQLIEAIRYGNGKLQMPPDGKLPESTIRNFEEWIRNGAADPRTATASVFVQGQAKNHWAWEEPSRKRVPKVKKVEWPSDRVDYFILSKLEAKGLAPSTSANRQTLLRRATLELTGIPPTSKQISQFLADKRPDKEAFESVVDSLLASESFGIRWGRHWLDIARFGESSGYSRNMLYPFAWRYRNYVIDSFNRDKPINQFIMEQIAGDLMEFEEYEQRDEQIIGTGFLTLGPKTFNEGNQLLFNLNVADEQIDATCRAFLGLTVNCARCHDHKYDPISAKDYYALAGIFLSSRNLAGAETNVRNEHSEAYPLGQDGWKRLKQIEQAKKQAEDAQILYLSLVKARNKVRKALEDKGIDWKKSPTPEYLAKEDAVQVQQKKVKRLKESVPSPPEFAMAVLEGMSGKDVELFEEKQKVREILISEMKKRGERLKEKIPDRPVIQDSHLYESGNHESPKEKVPRGSLDMLGHPIRSIGNDESGRLQLAEWIVNERNPLTARVFVNRVWHHLFGKGLVETVDNFGFLGANPSHPDLLDMLALDFMQKGWSLKQLVRRLMLTSTYRQSSANHSGNHAKDPANTLLWRFKPQLLEGEAIRDSILAVAGTLDFGRPKESQVLLISRQQALGRQREIGRRDYYKKDVNWEIPNRSIYLPMARDALPDVLATFDAPDPNLVAGARSLTVVPTQSLFLMNSKMAIGSARAIAEKVCEEEESNRIPFAYQLILGRNPDENERRTTRSFLKDGEDREKTWAHICQALLCSGEFRILF